MGQPGTVFTADNAKNYLKEYNKNYLGEQIWLNAFNTIDKNYRSAVTDLAIAEGKQESNALRDYSANITEAYKTAMMQRNQIAASNLGQGFKNQLFTDIDTNLDNAYNSYLQNYLSNRQNIQSNYLNNVNGIYEAHQAATEEVDKLLNEQAQNTANYLNAHFDYADAMLNKLYNENPNVLSEDQYQDYVIREMVNGQLQVTGIKDISAIRDMMFDSTDNGYELNDRGKDFFRQMQQLGLEENGYSFGDYLYENDADLFDWSMSINEYDSTYSDLRGNTNRASALGAIGLADNGFVASGNYEWKGGSATDNYYKNTQTTASSVNSYGGTLTSYKSNQGDVGVWKPYDESTDGVKGYKVTGLKNKDNNNFTIVYNDERQANQYGLPVVKKYKLELISTKDDPTAEMDDKTLTDIDKAVGGLVTNTMYYWNDDIWIAMQDEDGTMKMRKVQGQSGSGAKDSASTDKDYADLLKQFTNRISYDVEPREYASTRKMSPSTLHI